MQDATYRGSELKRWRKQVNLVLGQLDEKQKRLVAGLLSNAVGRGGVTQLARITGLDRKTVRRGRDELDNDLKDCPTDRVRREGAGRPPVADRPRLRIGSAAASAAGPESLKRIRLWPVWRCPPA